jgi:hypothetical protein
MIPPSPSSSNISPLAVSSTHEAELIRSIEDGDRATDDLDETRSLTESIRQHIMDGNLRYHSYRQGRYLFPNDEAEQDREELKHNLTVYLCDGKLFFAPIEDLLEKGAEVLDLGTGIGKWCIDRKSSRGDFKMRKKIMRAQSLTSNSCRHLPKIAVPWHGSFTYTA